MYIFGIDMPLMEILFVISLLYLIGLAVTFFEIRNLKKMMTEEKSDINQLQSTISALSRKR